MLSIHFKIFGTILIRKSRYETVRHALHLDIYGHVFGVFLGFFGPGGVMFSPVIISNIVLMLVSYVIDTHVNHSTC